MPSYAFVLPFAIENEMATVLLAERNLISRREAKKTITGTIPEWAGQWGLMGDVIGDGETAEKAATRVLRDQASIDLTDAGVVANFILGNRTVVTMKTQDLTPFSVMCIFTTATALGLLASSVTGAITAQQTASDLLGSTVTLPIDKARQRLGACAPPPKGWQDYLIQNYYGGKAPGQFNTDQVKLENTLTANAKQDNSFFTTALSDTE